MRVLQITEVAVDLNAQPRQFAPNSTVVAINATAAPITLQESDESGAGFATLATIGAGQAANVTLSKQFAKLSAAGFLPLMAD